MTGTTYLNPGGTITYYRCPHNPATPRHAASHPDHPRTVQAPEALLDRIIGGFFATRIFGTGRAALLAAQLPATDEDAAAERDAQAAKLQARIRRIETAQNSQILELEDLPADPADTAAAAMRARIRARFADLHHEREQIETQLTALAKTTPAAADPALLDELPLLGDIMPGLPPALKARLLAAFGLEILWNKPGQQVTVFAEITENTLQAIPGITDPSRDGYHDTDTPDDPDDAASMWDLGNTPRCGPMTHRAASDTSTAPRSWRRPATRHTTSSTSAWPRPCRPRGGAACGTRSSRPGAPLPGTCQQSRSPATTADPASCARASCPSPASRSGRLPPEAHGTQPSCSTACASTADS